MAFWRRTTPVEADLDNLGALAKAAPILENSHRILPTGTASLCYRPSDNHGFRKAESSARDLLGHCGEHPGTVQVHSDDYGFRWLVVRREPVLYPTLVTDLRAAGRTFADNKFGAQLLTAVAVFEQADRLSMALVYLCKRGTLYPFAPLAEESRNNGLEVSVKDVLDEHVPVEPDLTRWFPLWDCPGLK